MKDLGGGVCGLSSVSPAQLSRRSPRSRSPSQGPARSVACSRNESSSDAGPKLTPREAGLPAQLIEAAAPSAVPTRPAPDLNVVLLTIDSLRADMPWAGYPRPIAPRLTELEARSVSYTRSYAVSSYTSMSLGGLLGGKLPGS